MDEPDAGGAVGWGRRLREASRRGREVLVVVTLGALLVGLGVADQRRQTDQSLEDLGREQTSLAAALGAYVAERAGAARRATSDEQAIGGLFAGLAPLERPGDLAIFLVVPERAGVLGRAGVVAAGEPLRRALLAGETSREVERDEAPSFGLPRRLAVAGLHRHEIDGQTWGVVTVATARRVRDRQYRAERRLVLEIVAVGALLAGYGVLVLRRERRQEELSRQVERRAAEQEREGLLARADKMAALAALGTGVAHEVASPLGAIRARVEQLQGKLGGDERAGRALRAIAEQVERIHGVMRGLLTLARGDRAAGERCEPGRLVEEAAAQVSHRFADGAALERRVAAGLPAVVGDPRLLEQALVNLLLNAVGAGASVVTLTVEASEGRVRFAVEDDGAGMSPEVMARATQPFFTTRPAGTGLGLAITREIAAHHQGQLALGPRLDGERGTRAVLALPAAAGDNPPS